jgi:hypothetical protein
MNQNSDHEDKGPHNCDGQCKGDSTYCGQFNICNLTSDWNNVFDTGTLRSCEHIKKYREDVGCD